MFIQFDTASASPEDVIILRAIANALAPHSKANDCSYAVGYTDDKETGSFVTSIDGTSDTDGIEGTEMTADATPAVMAEPAAKAARKAREKKEKPPPAPVEATAETAALAMVAPASVAGSLGEDSSLPSGVPAEAIVLDVVTPAVVVETVPEVVVVAEVQAAPAEENLDELLAMVDSPAPTPEPTGDKYDQMTDDALRAEFLARVKTKGGHWFRDRILERGKKNTQDLKREDFLAIVRQADAS